MVATVLLDKKIKLEGEMRERASHKHKSILLTGPSPVLHLCEVKM
jgi:hypothetical protein